MIDSIGVYISDSFDPYINLAREKYLFDTTQKNSCVLYLWQNENTVVIGRNQNPWTECSCSLLEKEGGKLARRLSGGGAVYHDVGNLNFTFICSRENYSLPRQMQVIQTACTLAGIETRLSGRNDILADNRKFSGNAFYNSGDMAYHHGTLMIDADTKKMQRYLTPSKAKLEAKGVKSVRSRVMNLKELSPSLTCDRMKEYMIIAFEKVYGLGPRAIDCPNHNEIKKLTEKYCSQDYLYGGSAPFTFSCEGRFNWGQLQLQMQIRNGVIDNVNVYTDSMDWTLAEKIKGALCGKRFHIKDMEFSMSASLPTEIVRDITELFQNQEL